MPYSKFIPQKLVPAWMQTPWWVLFWTAIGTIFDVASLGVKNAIKARFPSTAYAATDALDAQGGERVLPRGSTGAGPETDLSFATRLQMAWSIWSWGGTAYGVLVALATEGYPGAIIETVGGLQYQIVGGGLVITVLPQVVGYPSIGTWLTRYNRAYWSEFQVLFASPWIPATANGALSNWAGGVPAQGSIEVQNLVTLIKRWRPAFARCAGIVVVTAGRCWDYPLGLTWGTLVGAGYTTWSGNVVTLLTVD